MSVVSERVIVRIDANVDAGSRCRNQGRLVEQIVLTVQPLLNSGATVTLIGTWGRPVIAPRDTFNRIRANNPALQFLTLASAIGQALGRNEPPVLQAMPTVQIPGYAIRDHLRLLENLAFDPREERNDQVLARQLAALGDRYLIDDVRALNDRSASIRSMPKAISTQLSQRVTTELAELDRLITHPKRPFVALIGGGHVDRKLEVIRRLGPVVDELLVSGEVATTFLAARGVDLKRTLVDATQIDVAKQLGGLLENRLTLPTDFVWRMHRIMDIGPQTRDRYTQSIVGAATILMTGPAGLVSLQLEAFHHGTASLVGSLHANQTAVRFVIGDDTVNQLPVTARASGITVLDGDAVALDYLASGKLVALDAIATSRFAHKS